MDQNKSLSTQEVADILHVSKSMIYELIRRGEIHSYKVGRKVRFTQEDVDGYIARSRHEQSTGTVRHVELESSFMTGEKDKPMFVISGQDILLDLLATHLNQMNVNSVRSYLSGFEGLLSLYQGKVHAAACHLFDWETREYNIPFVKRLMPGIPATVVNLSYRRQGFYVASGNPKNITGWKDILRDDVTIINRRCGSASRILLDGKLRSMEVMPQHVRGYGNIVNSHLTMATEIAEGKADLGLGTERISRKLDGVEFVPLVRERYDLVLRSEELDQPEVQKLFRVLREDEVFRKEIASVSGNDCRDLGRIIAEV